MLLKLLLVYVLVCHSYSCPMIAFWADCVVHRSLRKLKCCLNVMKKDFNLQYINGFITEFELAIIWLIAFILATLDIFEAFRYQYYVVYVYYSNHMLPKSISLWLKYGNQLLIYLKYQVFHMGHMIWSLWYGPYDMVPMTWTL